MPRNAIDYYLACVDEGSRCEWCRFPYEPLRCKGLCSHCYRISREIIKAEKNHRRYKSHDTEFNLKIEKKKAELAKSEGQTYWPLKNKNVTGLDIEHQFYFLSNHLIKEELFAHTANHFNEKFTQEQRRLLYFFITKLNRKWDRQHRMGTAIGLIMKTLNRQD